MAKVKKDDVPADVICPSWHFLPGPYQDDPDRQNCPLADTHKGQRKAWNRGLDEYPDMTGWDGWG